MNINIDLRQPNHKSSLYKVNEIMKKYILLLITIAILSSCSNDDDSTRIVNMRINHYQNTAIGFLNPVLTLLVQEDDAIGTNNWNRFYDGIAGFDYVPGKIYDLSVKVEKIKNPPADGSSYKFTLLKVKSIQEVDNETLFEVDLKKNEQNFVTKNSGYKILNRIEIDCNMLCDELESRLQNQDLVVGTFKRVSNNKIQLIELK